MKPIGTMTDLRNDLLETYSKVGLGSIELAVAKEKSNAADKIIKSSMVQLQYAKQRREVPEIPFLK